MEKPTAGKDYHTLFVFFLQAYERKLDDGRLQDSVELEIFAENEKEAFEKAAKIIKKPYYRIWKVFEKDIWPSPRT